MIQMIFLGPIIYYVVKKYDVFGFLICFGLTAAWEAVSYTVNLGDKLYAIIVLRYISLFAFGCYIAIGKKKLNSIVLIILFVFGVIWQTLLNYIPLYPPLMNYSWARVNLYSSLFILPIMYVLIRKFNDTSKSIPIVKDCGKASYNIFLVQMVFYGCGSAQLVYKFISNGVLQFIICFAFCTTIGYLYYIIEKPITNKIISTVHGRFS